MKFLMANWIYEGSTPSISTLLTSKLWIMDKEKDNNTHEEEEYNSKHDFPGDNMVEEWVN